MAGDDEGDERIEKKLRLTPEAWEAFDRYRRRFNVTFNALGEAIGLHLADDPDWFGDDVGRTAQRIDLSRYSRRDRG